MTEYLKRGILLVHRKEGYSMNKRQRNKYHEYWDEWADFIPYKELPKLHLWAKYSKRWKRRRGPAPRWKRGYHNGNIRWRKVLLWEYKLLIKKFGKQVI